MKSCRTGQASLCAREGQTSSTLPRKAVWDAFVADRTLHRRYNIRPAELESLKRAAMLGRLYSKQDLLFMLSVIRCALRH
jgi:hypothetical protein